MKKLFLLSLVSVFAASANAEVKELKIFPTTNIWLAYLKDLVPKFEAECKCKVTHIHPPDLILPSHRVMKDIHAGLAEIGMASIAFEEWIKLTEEKEKIPNADLKKLTFRVVGKDVIKLITHPDVNVSALSDKQVEDLFLGNIKNWSEIGGKKVDVKVALISSTASRNRFIETRLLGGKKLPPQVKMLESYEAMNKFVSNEPGAISFLATNEIDAKSKFGFPKTVVYGRPNTLITVGKPSPLAEQFIDYIRKHAPSPE